jgi:hypothetical protein
VYLFLVWQRPLGRSITTTSLFRFMLRVLLVLPPVLLTINPPLAQAAVVKNSRDLQREANKIRIESIRRLTMKFEEAQSADEVYGSVYDYFEQEGVSAITEGGRGRWIMLARQAQAHIEKTGVLDFNLIEDMVAQAYPGPRDGRVLPEAIPMEKLSGAKRPLVTPPLAENYTANYVHFIMRPEETLHFAEIRSMEMKLYGASVTSIILSPEYEGRSITFNWNGLDNTGNMLRSGEYRAEHYLLDSSGQPIAKPTKNIFTVTGLHQNKLAEQIDEAELRAAIREFLQNEKADLESDEFLDFFLRYWGGQKLTEEEKELFKQHRTRGSSWGLGGAGGGVGWLLIVVAIILVILFSITVYVLVLALLSVFFGIYYYSYENEDDLARQIEERIDELNGAIINYNDEIRENYIIRYPFSWF